MNPVQRIPHLWIPLPDGTRMAARLWLPEDAHRRPVPALLEAVPYRKGDLTAAADARWHGYLASRGYACLRLDLRGSGDSEGLLRDEYLPREQADNAAVIAWLARQPWCSGRVGMFGYSWGGFAALQTAALAPPELGAILSHCSTDDRYLGDCHWMGGCLLGSDMLKWATWLMAFMALPPDPAAFGPAWREAWQARLAALVPPAELWLAHPLRDTYWDQGSVGREPGAIRCPVMATGGWADPYVDTVFRLAESLGGRVPFHGLVGPWSHVWPDVGLPGPAIRYWDLALAWFDRWLKDEPNAVDAWPRLRAYVQESRPPDPAEVEVPGRWLALDEAGQPRSIPLRLRVIAESPEALQVEVAAGPTSYATLHPSPRLGRQAGVWCPAGRPGELPADQAPDDALSLCLEAEAAAADEDLMGIPWLSLRLCPSGPGGLVAARLCDVAPDGRSLLVSWGLLNLRRSAGFRTDRALRPGDWIRRRLPLRASGHRLAKGHRWRLALSASYWPHAWPDAAQAPFAIDLDRLRLELPVHHAGAARPIPRGELGPALAQTGQPGGGRILREASWQRRTADLPDGGIRILDRSDGGARRAADGVLTAERALDRYRWRGHTGAAPEVLAWREVEVGRAGWRAKVLAASRLTSTDRHFIINSHVIATWEGERVFRLQRRKALPRRGA